MKRFLLCLSLTIASAAYAGELEDANALFEKKDYAGALKLYTKLANASALAQVRVMRSASVSAPTAM